MLAPKTAAYLDYAERKSKVPDRKLSLNKNGLLSRQTMT